MRHENRGLRLFFPIIIVISCSHLTLSQYFKDSARGEKLYVISSLKAYNASITTNADKRLVVLKSIAPQIVNDLKYGSLHNFTKQILYKDPEAYLRFPAALALKKVNDELMDSGYALKVFDAYRPYSITKKMWKLVRDRRFVANPAKGSGHNRGISVDLTIIKISTGKELDMGTGFDDFTEKASHSYIDFPKEVLQNRTLLKKIMQKHGFLALQTEWWHYILPKAEEFELLDLSFEDLKDVDLQNL